MNKFYFIIILLITGFVSCFIYLYTEINKAEQQLEITKNNYFELKSLIAQIPSELSQTKSLSTSLFYRLDEISKKMNLSQQIESINPSSGAENYSEKLEIQLTNLYLDQCIVWINFWQTYPDIQIDQLLMNKNSQKFFQLSMSIIRYE